MKTELEDALVRMARTIAGIVNSLPEQCKFCGSKKIVRYGHYRRIQRWWCKDCQCKFTEIEPADKYD